MIHPSADSSIISSRLCCIYSACLLLPFCYCHHRLCCNPACVLCSGKKRSNSIYRKKRAFKDKKKNTRNGTVTQPVQHLVCVHVDLFICVDSRRRKAFNPLPMFSLSSFLLECISISLYTGSSGQIGRHLSALILFVSVTRRRTRYICIFFLSFAKKLFLFLKNRREKERDTLKRFFL